MKEKFRVLGRLKYSPMIGRKRLDELWLFLLSLPLGVLPVIYLSDAGVYICFLVWIFGVLCSFFNIHRIIWMRYRYYSAQKIEDESDLLGMVNYEDDTDSFR